MKNKSVHNCRFFHHAKFDCIMERLNKLFKVEFERGELEKSPTFLIVLDRLKINLKSIQFYPKLFLSVRVKPQGHRKAQQIMKTLAYKKHQQNDFWKCQMIVLYPLL